MNITCPECKATIFTPSNDTDYHKRLLDGHVNAVHGNERDRMVKLLKESIAVLQLVDAQGGIGKVYSKFQARELINKISDVVKLPRQNTTTDVPPVVPVPATPDKTGTTQLMNTGNAGRPPKLTRPARNTAPRVVTQEEKKD